MKSQTLAWGVLALSIGLSPALAAGTIHVALQIKPGLWEFIDTPKVTGDSVFSDAMLAHIPAAQRAQFLAETRKQMAAPHRARECMTQAKFEQRVSFNVSSCTRTVVSNTANALEIRTTCRSESQGTKQSTEQKIVTSNPALVISSLHAVSARGGKTMIIDTTEAGRWISGGCPLKDNEIQQVQ
jgi:hypothetical protein